MASDTTAPTLTSISLSASSIDPHSGQTTLVVTAQFADDLSGIFDGTYADGSGGSPPQIRFVSPSGQIVTGLFDILHPLSGNSLNGEYQATITLGANAEAGNWQVQYLLLNDEAGNSHSYTGAELAALGLTTSFTVTPGNAITDDYAASTATTGVVAIGGSTTGNIETTGDADWFKVTLTAGQSYRFDLEGNDTGQGTLSDPILQLLNSAGAAIATDFDTGVGGNAQITFAPSVSGTYYLSAFTSSGLGTYNLSAIDLGPGGDDYAASTATTGVVAIGGSTTGNIETTGDADWFKVTLTAGQSYRFDLEGNDTGQGTLSDPILQLLNSAGAAIATDFDTGVGGNAQITFAPSVSGTYYLVSSGPGLGTYKLSATDLGSAGDPTPPTISSIASSGPSITNGNGDLNAGKIVTLTVDWSEAVTVTGGAPKLLLSDGGTATYTAGSGTSALAFTYTVLAGQNTNDLSVSSLDLNGATIKDSSGNNADLAGASNYNPSGILKIDTTAPLVAIGSTGGPTNQPVQTVSGTVDVSEADITVTLYEGTNVLGTAVVQNNGSWSANVTLTGNGTHALIAKATDAAGNTGTSNPITFILEIAPPSTSAEDIQAYAFGITRTQLPLDQATSIANLINAGLQNEAQLINNLLSQVTNTTFPAVAVEGSMYDAVGTSAEITKLVTEFLPAQVAHAILHGYHPLVYASEALGLVFAFGDENGGTGFANQFGPSNAAMPNSSAGDAAFAAAAASAIFGASATANTPVAIQTWVANWKAFYTINGVVGVPNATADQIDLAARGAAWGDAVGVALANNLGLLPAQVTNFLENAAQGTAVYSASLSSQPDAAQFQGAPTAPDAGVQLVGIGAELDHVPLS